MLFVLTNWVVLAGLYLLFAGQLSGSEVIAGVPASLAAAVFALLVHRVQPRRFQVRAPWLRVVVRPIAALFPDAARVGTMLLRAMWRRPDGPLGVISQQPFRHGGNQPGDAGRRALTTLGLSLAPNGYVLLVPDDRDMLPVHRLAPAVMGSDPEWPA